MQDETLPQSLESCDGLGEGTEPNHCLPNNSTRTCEWILLSLL